MGIHLYDLTAELRELQFLAQQEEVPPEELHQRIDSIGMESADKIVNIVKLQRELEAEAAVYKAEKDRMAAKEKAAKSAADRLKSYALFHAEAQNIAPIRRPEFTITLSENPAYSVVIEDESRIPQCFYVARPAELSKALVIEALKEHAKAQKERDAAYAAEHDGELPDPIPSPAPGAYITRGKHLRVR